MAERKGTKTARRGIRPVRPVLKGPRAKTGDADRSFGKVLQSRSVDEILPETVTRLEAGRRSFASEALKSVATELTVLDAEEKRLEKDGAEEGKVARLARLRSVVEADLLATSGVSEQIERGVRHEPQGWTVIGRVRSEKPLPARAEIVFVDDNNEPVKELEAVPVQADGVVWRSYPADVAKQLEERRARVAPALRVGKRIVQTGATRTQIRANHVYQFELPIDGSAKPSKR